MATAAASVLAEPEKQLPALAPVQALCDSPDGITARLAMLTLLAVYKDIVPGYRVRLPTAQEAAVPVSSEIRELRTYEANLLRSYQAYLQILLRAVKAIEGESVLAEAAGKRKAYEDKVARARAATQCLGQLLNAHSHFNYTSGNRNNANTQS